MPCYHPLTGYISRDRLDYNPATKKTRIVFDSSKGYPGTKMSLPCGQCSGCRLERSRQWAVRCIHEASLYRDNCFITLTYDNENLPAFHKSIYNTSDISSNLRDFDRSQGSSLDKSAFVNFMKRLRKKYGAGIRFFHCGEYGDKFQRPHHHACLFNFDFPDKVLWSIKRGNKLYRSESLEKLWPFGFCTIGEVTFESAAYVARYIMKKRTGRSAEEYYDGRTPEYVTMSRKQGIGRSWYDRFKDDLYPHDKCVVRDDFIVKPSRYYDELHARTFPEIIADLKKKRKAMAEASPDNTEERLAVREKSQDLKTKKLVRSYEHE